MPPSNLRPRSPAWAVLVWILIALIFVSGVVGLYYCRTLEIPPEKEAELRPQINELTSVSYGCLAVSVICAGIWILAGKWRKPRT